jgi:hypothetical protein
MVDKHYNCKGKGKIMWKFVCERKKKIYSINCWVLLLCEYNQVQKKLSLISKQMNIYLRWV